MKKRGLAVTQLATIIFMAFAIIFILINVLLRSGPISISSEEPKEEELEKGMPAAVLELYNSLVDEFGQQDQPGKCLRRHKPFPGSLGGYRIIIKRDYEKKGTNLLLINKKGEEVKYEHIPNIVPCVIAEKEAIAFHDNWAKYIDSKMKIGKDYAEFDLIELRDTTALIKKGIWVVFNGETHNIQDRGMLYQADQNHICFIPTHRYMSIWCDVPQERYGFPPTTYENPDLILLRSCLDLIEQSIPPCISCEEVDDCSDYWPGYQCSADPCDVSKTDPCFQMEYPDGSVSKCTSGSLWSCSYLDRKHCDSFPDRCKWIGGQIPTGGECIDFR